MTAIAAATVTAPQMVTGSKNHQTVFKIKIVRRNFWPHCCGIF
jgi:hypothetical protein